MLFVTDEIFLPHKNGSSRIYTNVAEKYAAAGWRTFCLSFHRDNEEACALPIVSAYREAFDDFILAPGWNLGGTLLGKLGMAIREISRWATGNIFASHPFLVARQAGFREQLLDFIRRERISQVYCHKPHTLLMLQPALKHLTQVGIVSDIHDDFVSRSVHYSAAYESLFASLSSFDIFRQHLPMYLRYKLSRTNIALSRRKEVDLLAQCDEVLVASEFEYLEYAQMPSLQGKVRFQPWPYEVSARPDRMRRSRPFDAGFIGADSVMNLDAVIHFRDNIWPLVQAKMPDFRMLLAGTLSRKVKPLLSGVSGLVVWDKLPRVDDFYDVIGLAAVPLRHGTGVSVKAIEAISYGCPLVTTTVGIRGIPAIGLSPYDIDIYDDCAGFASALTTRAMKTRAAGGSG